MSAGDASTRLSEFLNLRVDAMIELEQFASAPGRCDAIRRRLVHINGIIAEEASIAAGLQFNERTAIVVGPGAKGEGETQ